MESSILPRAQRAIWTWWTATLNTGFSNRKSVDTVCGRIEWWLSLPSQPWIVHGAPSLIIWKGQGSKKLQTNEQKVESSLSMTCTRHSERKRAIWCGGWHLPQNADLLAFAGTWPYGGSHPLPNAWSFPSAFFFFFFFLAYPWGWTDCQGSPDIEEKSKTWNKQTKQPSKSMALEGTKTNTQTNCHFHTPPRKWERRIVTMRLAGTKERH